MLFNWMWHQGMLKGTDERDMVAMLEYQAKGGTIQVDGQPCTLSKFRESTNYQTFSQRIQSTCTRAEQADGLEHRGGQLAVRVERGHARRGDRRNERQGRGDAGSRAGAAHSHLGESAGRGQVRAGRDHGHMDAGREPGHRDPRRRDEGRQHVRCRGTPRARRSLTFPIPGVAGATGTATLDAKYMTEKVVVTQGATTTEFTYSNYQDWNNPLNKIEVFYAGRLTERKNGAVVRDLTTSETETGNVYVVAPVPPSVQKAMNVTAKAPTIVWAKQEPPANTTAPMPRLGAHPDLTGTWAWNDWIGNYGSRRCGPTQVRPCNRQTNQTEDFELYSPSRFGQLTRPLYKPEYWDKVQQLDMWTNKEDPVMTCQPLGLPRQGPPRRIYQTENDITFLYGQFADAGGGLAEFRVVPIDGRSTARTPSTRPVLRRHGGTLGGRYARARLHRLHRHDMDRTWRVLPFRPDARRREVQA